MTELEDGWKLRDASSYDDHARHYDRAIRLLAAPLAERIGRLARLRPGQRVLDVGTGSGVAARRASEMLGAAGHVTAIDLSRGMIESAAAAGAPEGGAPIAFRIMDAEHLAFDDGAFDAVISLCAVLHFPDITSALSEMVRVLRPGGRLVVSFGNPRPLPSLPPLPPLRHTMRQAVRFALKPVRPTVKAPVDLLALIASYAPPDEEEDLTRWSRRDPLGRLRREMRAAGLADVEVAAETHEVRFDDAEAFWEAQAAVVTLARKRMALLDQAQCDEIRERYLALCRHALARGGRLLYPFGAHFAAGTRPG